jgi:1-phosphatidylinositol phosphodiesterase
MAPLDGKKRLSEFTIPGTHDSGALHEAEAFGRPIAGTTQCQMLPIATQLSIGVRFLDMRCVLKQDGFQIYHGDVDQQISFGSVLNDCLSFLKSHPGETIIMSVKKEHGNDDDTKFEAMFDWYTAKGPQSWLLTDTLPALDTTRGKIVLLRRFAAAKLPKGIAAAPDQWQDNQSFQINGAVAIHVQDRYRLGNKQQKWPEVQALLQAAFHGQPDVFYLNFTSAYVEKTIFHIPGIREAAKAVTPALLTYFDQAPPGRYGVVIVDFADAPKCSKIVATNK